MASGMAAGQIEQISLHECLKQMEALADEIGTAMQAIARNSLPSLQKSLHIQQLQTARLKAILTKVQPIAIPDEGAPPALSLRLRQAASKLNGLNEQYAVLLEHSGRSLRMLQSLYRHSTVTSDHISSITSMRNACCWKG